MSRSLLKYTAGGLVWDFPYVRSQAASIPKRTARVKRNGLLRRDSCLRRCFIVTILACRLRDDGSGPFPRSISFCPHQSPSSSRVAPLNSVEPTAGGTPNRWMRSRIAANNSRDTATSAIWNVMYFAQRFTLEAGLGLLVWSVQILQRPFDLGLIGISAKRFLPPAAGLWDLR